MTNSLPIDTYYRGYRLSKTNVGKPTEQVRVFHEADLIEIVPTTEQARKDIDSWHDAR